MRIAIYRKSMRDEKYIILLARNKKKTLWERFKRIHPKPCNLIAINKSVGVLTLWDILIGEYGVAISTLYIPAFF